MSLVPLTLLLNACTADAGQALAVSPPASFNPQSTLAPLIEAVEPAVVNVYVTTRHAVPALYQMYGYPSQQVVQGQGSGFVISPDGMILTNNHVIQGATELKVKFDSGDEYAATVAGADRGSDVALLQIKAGKVLPYLKLGDSDAARVGDWVVAVGNPLGLGHTVTAGIISAKGREIPDLDALEEFIQTDAGINPGNSGGPLIGLDGAVLGMNTAIVSGANSVAFAIPAAHLDWVLPQLREHGMVSRGWLGVGSAPLNARGLATYKVDHGVVITELSNRSPAELAGLVTGDVVLQIQDREIHDAKDLFRTIASRAPGDEVTIHTLHEGKPREVKVKLGERPQG